ncbi:Hypothetical_protein [Hexamita inflata]|uniref:Hypothetical_protein n=1 Tax=Hexamita inflata TaxID=28002 RepID=A0AA86QDF2_9EUKA|nr:Hypothetical protein HINF_LOCUS38649 [Hexamita inflata]
MVALNVYLASITDKQVTFQEETQIIKHLMQWLTYTQKKLQITLITFIQTMMKTKFMSDIHLINNNLLIYICQFTFKSDNFKQILARILAQIKFIPANMFKHAVKNNAKKLYPGPCLVKRALFLRVCACLDTQKPAKTHLNGIIEKTLLST